MVEVPPENRLIPSKDPIMISLFVAVCFVVILVAQITEVDNKVK